MIVKFHARGRGGGSGPVDYLLGENRQRPGSRVLQGKAEEVRELIDASPYAKKYTSGVLSFAEADLPAGQRETLMASFERILMPGLDKDQFSVLWVEHTDKGRLELNFLIPNTELLSGKRLQPYYDRADRPRIDAWQTVVNGSLGLSDPNDPANRRALVTPNTLPKTKQEAAEILTASLMRLCETGEIRTRQDVTDALEKSGFEVVRTTKSSISIASPDGGQNIRLKGALYEQSFNAGEGLGAEIEGAAARYRADAENRIQRARSVCQSGTERKREANQRRHPRPRRETGLSHQKEHQGDAEDRRADVDIYRPGVVIADLHERGHSVVAGADAPQQSAGNPGAGRHADETERRYMGREVPDGRERAAVSGDAGRNKTGSDPLQRYDVDRTETGLTEHDRTGNAIIERIRATAAGLRAAAERVGSRLLGVAEDVWHYATGERGAERARIGLEQAGAEFERAAAPLVHQMNVIEQRLEHEKAVQHQKTLEPERPQRQKGLDGPTLG
jgi:hypothetical protein